MYKQKNNKINKNNGITLIALVLTIIVLLILAAVVISLALGDNGLLFRAKRSKQDEQIAQEKDKIIAGYGATLANNKGEYKDNLLETELKKDGSNVTVSGNTVIYNHDEYNNIYTLNINEGKVANHEQKSMFPLPTELEAGDTVIYDPTKDVTDTSKLTYTSKKGTPRTGGNGDGDGTITAKSSDNEWIVVSKANNQLKLISKSKIKGNFRLGNATGWLYTEEELNKACSIYGYGKGADKSKTFNYTIGNYQIPGEAKMRTLTGSGARSLIMSDISEIMKGDGNFEFTEDEKQKLSTYYSTSLSSHKVYSPSINKDYNDFYEDLDYFKMKVKNDEFSIDETSYNQELTTNTEINKNKMILKKYIFLEESNIASRCISSSGQFNIYMCHSTENKKIDGSLLLEHTDENSVGSGVEKVYLRPIVYLEKGIGLEKQNNGVWKIK